MMTPKEKYQYIHGLYRIYDGIGRKINRHIYYGGDESDACVIAWKRDRDVVGYEINLFLIKNRRYECAHEHLWQWHKYPRRNSLGIYMRHSGKPDGLDRLLGYRTAKARIAANREITLNE